MVVDCDVVCLWVVIEVVVDYLMLCYVDDDFVMFMCVIGLWCIVFDVIVVCVWVGVVSDFDGLCVVVDFDIVYVDFVESCWLCENFVDVIVVLIGVLLIVFDVDVGVVFV